MTKAVLEKLSNQHSDDEVGEDDLRYAIIKSSECITGRHLLEQTVGAVARVLEWKEKIGRCESLPQLVVELEKLLGNWNKHSPRDDSKQRLVLVFDGIDRQREAQPTLLPALARLGEIVGGGTALAISFLTQDGRYQISPQYSSSHHRRQTFYTTPGYHTSTSHPILKLLCSKF